MVTCAYCGGKAELVSGRAIYPHRFDLAEKSFWRCVPCEAWVGVHDGTVIPLGRLANATLRRAKSEAHRVFDPFWRGRWKRGAAYRWLAQRLGIDGSACHIGMFDEEQCRRVVEIVQAEVRKERSEIMSGLVEYPVPLGDGRFGYLRLPSDLTQRDVQRIVAILNTLIVPVSTDGGNEHQAVAAVAKG